MTVNKKIESKYCTNWFEVPDIKIQDMVKQFYPVSPYLTPKLHVKTQLGSTDSNGRVVYVHSEIQSVPTQLKCAHMLPVFLLKGN